jgi:RNA polymerase sigma-70 factor (ECF subfamily)
LFIVDTVSRFDRQLASEQTVGSPPGDRAAGARPDELLRLAQAAATDSEAAATLVVHVGGPMLRVVRKVLGRAHADVDDVAQDAVVALLQALAMFRGECSVDHFARRIALLTALAARRRVQQRARRADADGSIVVDEVAGNAPSPLADTVAGRRRELVRRLLDELPDVIAEALALHFILGYTVEEIAAAASVPVNTVWSRLRLGKRALRRKLSSDAQLAEMLEVAR